MNTRLLHDTNFERYHGMTPADLPDGWKNMDSTGRWALSGDPNNVASGPHGAAFACGSNQIGHRVSGLICTNGSGRPHVLRQYNGVSDPFLATAYGAQNHAIAILFKWTTADIFRVCVAATYASDHEILVAWNGSGGNTITPTMYQKKAGALTGGWTNGSATLTNGSRYWAIFERRQPSAGSNSMRFYITTEADPSTSIMTSGNLLLNTASITDAVFTDAVQHGFTMEGGNLQGPIYRAKSLVLGLSADSDGGHIWFDEGNTTNSTIAIKGFLPWYAGGPTYSLTRWERCTAPDFSSASVTTISPGANATLGYLNDTTAVAGTMYWYRRVATDGAAHTLTSDPVAATLATASPIRLSMLGTSVEQFDVNPGLYPSGYDYVFGNVGLVLERELSDSGLINPRVYTGAMSGATASGVMTYIVSCPGAIQNTTTAYLRCPVAGTINGASFTVTSTVATHASNIWTVGITNVTATKTVVDASTAANSNNSTGGSAFTANVARSLTLSGTPANLDFAAGDILKIVFTKAASAADLQDLIASVTTAAGATYKFHALSTAIAAPRAQSFTPTDYIVALGENDSGTSVVSFGSSIDSIISEIRTHDATARIHLVAPLCHVPMSNSRTLSSLQRVQDLAAALNARQNVGNRIYVSTFNPFRALAMRQTGLKDGLHLNRDGGRLWAAGVASHVVNAVGGRLNRLFTTGPATPISYA